MLIVEMKDSMHRIVTPRPKVKDFLQRRKAVSVQDKVMALARSQIGVREFPMGSNCVKYNNEYYGLEVRGGAYPWCCVFQWWLFR